MIADFLLLPMMIQLQELRHLPRSRHALKEQNSQKKNFQNKIFMPHINFNNDLPGIRSAMAYSPKTAKPLNELAEVLLRSDEGLSRIDGKLIQTMFSYSTIVFIAIIRMEKLHVIIQVATAIW